MTQRARLRGMAVLLSAFMALYLSWQLLRWIPGSRQNVGDLLLPPLDAVAVLASWSASRRCARSPRLRVFWRLLAFALAAELIGDVVEAVYDVGLHQEAYPSWADPAYLAFYPLLLLALWRVPVAPISRSKLLRMTLDGATIVLGGGAIVWYFVLGPTALAGGQSPLAMGVSLAFPVGDLFLMAGIAAVLLRQSAATLRVPLRLITAAVVTGIVADVLYGYGQLHGTYRPGDVVDLLYVIEFALFALAATTQRDAPHGASDTEIGGIAQSRSRASWLPYLSVTIGLGTLIAVEMSGSPFFPDVSLALIVTALAVLVGIRQYVAQRELVSTQAALRRSERVKDEFLAITGHELRTPLTSIRGSLGLLDGGIVGELPEQAAELVRVAVVNADRLVRLIDDILDIERIAAGHLTLDPETVSAGELVRQSMQVVRSAADAAWVRLRCDAAPISVLADAERIIQVLVNLLGNAVKFSTRGGQVRVTVGQAGADAVFSVSDSGRGIPADQLESVFDRFRQVNATDSREKGGTGLGLPIARSIVEQHGGRIWAERNDGGGSTLRFTLPLAAVADRAAASGAALEHLTGVG